MNAQGTDRAHKIPSGSIINSTLGPVLDFTILRFGLGLEVDDAPTLWASKVTRLLGYWLPTTHHLGADQAVALVNAIRGYDVLGAALDYEAIGDGTIPTLAQVQDFRDTFRAARPDLPLGFYGTRFTIPTFGAGFDWTWMAGDPQGVGYDMLQTVSGGVDHDEWQGNLADFDAFFGGDDMALTASEGRALALVGGYDDFLNDKGRPPLGDPDYKGSDGADHSPAAGRGWDLAQAEAAHRASDGSSGASSNHVHTGPGVNVTATPTTVTTGPPIEP